jgi:DNA-binding LacI/PurR family transcriptional regulator
MLLNTGAPGVLPTRLLDGSVPVVEIFGTASGCQVHADNFGGARKGVDHLLSLGHRRIAHFAGPQSQPAYQERLRGFLDAVHEAGLRMDATPVIHNDADLAEVLRSQSRPTGLLAYSDSAAVAAYRQARASGLTVPADLSIVGFDDEAFAGSIEPALTTLRVDPELVAGSAFALLERQFAREAVPGQTLVPTGLIVRASSAAN